MELFAIVIDLWHSMAPTTWFLILGVLISLNLLKKTLF